MNFHSDEWIMARLKEHYDEAQLYFPKERIVGIFIQGSQNYGLDYEGSDIDTKLIIVPSLENIVLNKQPVSTTHVRENNEHIDFKDIRLYMDTFIKQNLNFLEILFTSYKIINPIYEKFWNKLVEAREDITHFDIHRSVRSMKGVALEKFHALEHRYPSKIEIIDKYGYDSKQLHHLLRVEEYLTRYMSGESYESCLQPKNADLLRKIKEDNGFYSLEEARKIAEESLERIENLTIEFLVKTPNMINREVEELIRNVQKDIMIEAIKREVSKV